MEEVVVVMAEVVRSGDAMVGEACCGGTKRYPPAPTLPTPPLGWWWCREGRGLV